MIVFEEDVGRSALLFGRLGDGVPTNPRLMAMVNEYDKLLLRRVALWTGWGA